MRPRVPPRALCLGAPTCRHRYLATGSLDPVRSQLGRSNRPAASYPQMVLRVLPRLPGRQVGGLDGMRANKWVFAAQPPELLALRP